MYKLGELITVTVDRPLGTYHPEGKDIFYTINYGYVQGVMAADGEEQDAYILGVNEPVEKFTGRFIAIIHRDDDIEEKWVVVKEGLSYSNEEIMKLVDFQEKYHKSYIKERYNY